MKPGISRLGVIILTCDEEVHLPRALESVEGIADRVWVVDSGSKDSTLRIAEEWGATVLYHPWTNYATQLNWGIEQAQEEVDWLLRLDADEYFDDELRRQILELRNNHDPEIVAYEFPRYTYFFSKPVKYGGVFPTYLVRLWKSGAGKCESRWHDEHIVIEHGVIKRLSGKLIDDNKKSLAWWVEKHNRYSNLEAVDLLLSGSEAYQNPGRMNSQARLKRWLKLRVYRRLPLTLRAGLYYFYRMYLRLGFLDSGPAREFHWMQAYWYRRLVDAKLIEVELYMERTDCSLKEAILDRLGIDIEQVK